MPTHRQTTVNAAITERQMGKAGTNNLRGIFTKSPIHTSDMTDDSIREQYQADVVDASINDGGHTFGTFETNYVEAPDLANVETGGGGLPASPHVPNPTSPGPGSLNPADQPEAPDGFGDTPSDTPFSGVGSQLGPKASSEKISGQTIGDYVMGKSSKE